MPVVDSALGVFLRHLGALNMNLAVVSKKSASESRSRGIIHCNLFSALRKYFIFWARIKKCINFLNKVD